MKDVCLGRKSDEFWGRKRVVYGSMPVVRRSAFRFTYVDPAVGLYVVRFYKNGVYQVHQALAGDASEDVVVDDQFPTKYGQCAFAKSGKRSEAWVQVIERLSLRNEGHRAWKHVKTE